MRGGFLRRRFLDRACCAERTRRTFAVVDALVLRRQSHAVERGPLDRRRARTGQRRQTMARPRYNRASVRDLAERQAEKLRAERSAPFAAPCVRLRETAFPRRAPAEGERMEYQHRPD